MTIPSTVPSLSHQDHRQIASHQQDWHSDSCGTTIADMTEADEINSEKMEKSFEEDLPYEGLGTDESPFVVSWKDGDTENPYNWSNLQRYTILAGLASAMLSVAVGSTMYGGAVPGMELEFKGISVTVAELGLSLYVLGFALGPLVWGPFSEVIGRRAILIVSMVPFVLSCVGVALSKSIAPLLFCRFLCGFFGASPINNGASTVGDLFNADERGAAMSVFALAAYCGPVVGPIAGSFLGQELPFRWVFWTITIYAGVSTVGGALIPETYAPFLLAKRAKTLQASTGFVYVSEYALKADKTETLSHKLLVSTKRPFHMLAKMIVLSFAIYIAFSYGTLYLFFGAFPIIFQDIRGWKMGVASLPFLGMGVGQTVAIGINIWDSRRYSRLVKASGGKPLPPEARLPMACIGGLFIPISLIWFAWTIQPSVHWIIPIIGSAPFGLGSVMVFLPLVNYMVDTYKMHAASAIAANAVFRSFFGTAFPIFTNKMFHGMTPRWALTLLSGISFLLCPIPYIFMRYGRRIRARSEYAPPETEPT